MDIYGFSLVSDNQTVQKKRIGSTLSVYLVTFFLTPFLS